MNMSSITKTVKLSHIQNGVDPKDLASTGRPSTLFIHGLDSSSHTWRSTLERLSSPGVAIDCRGYGASPLGNPKDFTPDALIEDIHDFVTSHPFFGKGAQDKAVRPFVIVGHSMGGRIAMSYAAKYPHHVSALIIEDMDIRTRPMEMNFIKSSDREATVSFKRNLNTMERSVVIAQFEKEGYMKNMSERWLDEGRIHLKDGQSYYSDVNPAFRLLCYEQFFLTSHGEDTWRTITNQNEPYFPCHVMVADKEYTVCDESSISQMNQIMKEKDDFRMILHRFKTATHSIHNSVSTEFMPHLEQIIESTSATSKR